MKGRQTEQAIIVSPRYIIVAKPQIFIFEAQHRSLCFALPKAGKSIAARLRYRIPQAIQSGKTSQMKMPWRHFEGFEASVSERTYDPNGPTLRPRQPEVKRLEMVRAAPRPGEAPTKTCH
jgi:hypothetical protein